jgi:RimJ/RimL family protein N-acetyltransferase
MQSAFTKVPVDGEAKSYKVTYAVHKILDSDEKLQPSKREQKPTEFIGLVTLASLEGKNLALPESLTIPAADAVTTHTVELAYMFLPTGWGKGYATESVNAVFQVCKSATAFWAPFSKVYVRAIVNEGNPASLRVMEKIGMKKRGIYEWTGKIWLAGGWRYKDNLHIFGMHLLE